MLLKSIDTVSNALYIEKKTIKGIEIQLFITDNGLSTFSIFTK